ncbi:MAG: hypothetical protein Q9217_001213 [Psora testacea]
MQQPVQQLAYELDLSRFNSELVKQPPVKFDELDDENWLEWSNHIRRFFSHRQLLGILDGSIPQPQNPYSVEARTWRSYADFMVLLMWYASTRRQRSYIDYNDHTTPKSMWDKWESIHTEKGQRRITALMYKLATRKYQKDDTVDKVAADIRITNKRIASIKERLKLDDEWIGLLIMNCFRAQQKYSTVMSYFDNEENLSSQKVISRLKKVEQNAKDRTYSKERQEQARVGEDTEPRKNLKCYNCGRKGHKARRCPRRDAESEDEASEGNERPLPRKKKSDKAFQKSARNGSRDNRKDQQKKLKTHGAAAVSL